VDKVVNEKCHKLSLKRRQTVIDCDSSNEQGESWRSDGQAAKSRSLFACNHKTKLDQEKGSETDDRKFNEKQKNTSLKRAQSNRLHAWKHEAFPV
jgi:hypothetical protein